MKNATPKNSKEVLLTLLRKKQKELGLGYITTENISYKIVRTLFILVLIYCLCINLLYILGKSGEMAANIANMGTPEPHQEIEIARLYTTIHIMIGATVGLALAEVFVWFKLPILQFVFNVASSVTIITRLSSEINDRTSYTLEANHIIPLSLLCILGAISGGLLFNQLYKDKKGCNELDKIIYTSYKVLPIDLPQSEWDNVLEAYNPPQKVKKKKAKKNKPVKLKGKRKFDDVIIIEPNNKAED
jgi:hypothetical protein